MQNMIEQNIDSLFNLELISSEFSVNDLRIDTVAFDNETKSFILIEYKNSKSQSVIDQGFTYLNTFEEKKEKFILHYNDIKGEHFPESFFDFESTRVIFVSPEFSKFQKGAINDSHPFSLYEIHLYEKNILHINEILGNKKAPSDKKLPKNSSDERLKIVKVYTEDSFFLKCSADVID